MKQFCQDMLEITDQKTLWNSLERTVNCLADSTVTNYYTTDGIQMYSGCAVHLTEREKKEILKEGFNQYTHDFLLRRFNRFADEGINTFSFERTEEIDVPFEIEQQFLALEYKTGPGFRKNPVTNEMEPVPDEERYCFFVARDSFTLKIIGSEMSNCVGWGYTDSVRKRRSTIVYAVHKGKYKICIEVSPQFTVRQAYGPHNHELQGEAYEAYTEWCKEKHIVRQKAFSFF